MVLKEDVNVWKSFAIGINDSMRNAIKLMDSSGRKLLIVYEKDLFKSLLSIGDIQRALLKNISLNEPVSKILRDHVNVANDSDTFQSIKSRMLKNRMEMMPVVDSNNQLIKVYQWEDVFSERFVQQSRSLNMPVVVMAGGKGSRLKPITNIIPKALVPIEEKPIIELILDRFKSSGASKFLIAVNYKAELIINYLNSLNSGFNIDFLREDKPLGTAGALHLLKGKIDECFFVTNCDIIVDEDYSQILDYHKASNNDMTLVAALKHYPIPYGILNTKEKGELVSIQEKPELTFKINSGMYILEPRLLEFIPNDKYYDITDLIDVVKRKGMKIGVFPISEGSWMDIGVWSEYEKTKERYSKEGGLGLR